MATLENTELFETKSGTFSTTGNGNFENVTRTGWMKTKLGIDKRLLIIGALNSTYTDTVYRKDGKIYRNLLNGNTEKLG